MIDNDDAVLAEEDHNGLVVQSDNLDVGVRPRDCRASTSVLMVNVGDNKAITTKEVAAKA